MRTRTATRAQGFTLLELIVTIVVVGVLAALTLPTFTAVIGRARDGRLVTTLSSTLRVANAIAAFRGPVSYQSFDLLAAADEIDGFTISLDPIGEASDPGQLHGVVARDGASAGLATRSEDGNCVLASIGPSGDVASFVQGPAEPCNGASAIAGSSVPAAIAPLSWAGDGTPGNSEARLAGWVGFSADNRYVVFESAASNLVTGDTNGVADVFVRDLQTNTVVRASVGTPGTQADASSCAGGISADGRYVAFQTTASNLVAGDTNGVGDIFVRDLATSTTTRVSTSAAGDQANSASPCAPRISANGTHVVFNSQATNLVTGDTNARVDTFVKDVATGAVTRASLSSTNAQLTSAPGPYPTITADGTKVVFYHASSSVVAGDTNGVGDIFVRDLVAGTTTRVSTDSDGVQGNAMSATFSMSASGRYLVFHSAASNLVAGDTNGVADIFVRDLVAGTTTRVSTSAAGAQANAASWSYPSISADGTKVAFISDASNLVAGDTNGLADAFVHDLTTGTVTLVSRADDGTPADASTSYADISPDGTRVLLFSTASNLVADDTNGVVDYFIRRL